MESLNKIGFYTMTDERCRNASSTSPLKRCEMVLTGRCNFKCPYCRRVGGPDLDFKQAAETVKLWAADGLSAIRFSGGEPTLYPGIYDLCAMARDLGIENIAISSNGSADFSVYQRLLASGVNDFSISLDACCAEDGDKMAGGVKGAWEKVVANIKVLSKLTYVTVGIVVTDDNIESINDIIWFAHELGVADIRVIPAAQDGDRLKNIQVDEYLLVAHPILRYRIANLIEGRTVRGLKASDTHSCPLAFDDMAVCGSDHYPCIIYMREGGKPIGKVGPNMRRERRRWVIDHDTHADAICSKNCLDVCADYNNKWIEFKS
jgi:MoaA/NifB/PqqE/SkfB family radical SAM enzyme